MDKDFEEWCLKGGAETVIWYELIDVQGNVAHCPFKGEILRFDSLTDALYNRGKYSGYDSVQAVEASVTQKQILEIPEGWD